jgi:hypothetical protein
MVCANCPYGDNANNGNATSAFDQQHNYIISKGSQVV